MPAPVPAVPAPSPAPAVVTGKPASPLQPATFAEVPGWSDDDLRQAWPAFQSSCTVLGKRAGWQEVCSIAALLDAASLPALRQFFQEQFIPHRVVNADGSTTGLVTGYYEPLLRGARARGGAFQTPLHRVPDDLLTLDVATLYPELKHLRLRGRVAGNKVVPYATRAELTQGDALLGKEIVWVDNPIDAFFLQVQGSGRVLLEESKETIRVAYADQNGHPYKSIGRYLVDRGELKLEQASMQGIKAWLASNPHRLQEVLNANPSYVFFREEKIADPSQGPKGALAVPLTAQRSLAIDPQYIPLGAPVFLATQHPGTGTPLRQLMLAQDTGGAIRNPVRADFFWGFGDIAGELAGKMKQPGEMWVLLPRTLTARGAPSP